MLLVVISSHYDGRFLILPDPIPGSNTYVYSARIRRLGGTDPHTPNLPHSTVVIYTRRRKGHDARSGTSV